MRSFTYKRFTLCSILLFLPLFSGCGHGEKMEADASVDAAGDAALCNFQECRESCAEQGLLGHCEVTACECYPRPGAGADADGDGDGDADSGFDAGVTCFRYVDIDSTASNPDGLSWATAFKTVQQGIDSAYQAVQVDGGDSVCDVWVVEGTYYVFQSVREDTITLRPGVHLYGGFIGTETSRDERDWKTNETVLEGCKEEVAPDAGFMDKYKVYHVVTGSDLSVIDGFTVIGGSTIWGGAGTPLPVDYFGAGLNNKNSSTNVRNCIFNLNESSNGGAIYNENSSSKISNCTFKKNGSMGEGGAISNINSAPTIANCIFEGNWARWGGGIYNKDSSTTVIDCTFSKNTAGSTGGGMSNDGSSSTVTGCIFSGNTASETGGGIGNYNNSTANISDCLFIDNASSSDPMDYGQGGGGMYNKYSAAFIYNCLFSNNYSVFGGGVSNYYSNAFIFGSIFAGNSAWSPGGIEDTDSTCNISDSILIGNTSENTGCISIYRSSQTITNCILYGNVGGKEGGIVIDAGNSKIENSIFWNNLPSEITSQDVTYPEITYSDIKQDLVGTGTINADPSFSGAPMDIGAWINVSFNADIYQTMLSPGKPIANQDTMKNLFLQPNVEDPRMFLIAGNTTTEILIWGNVTDFVTKGDTYRIFDLHLNADSPCIDTAFDDDAPSTDIEGNPRMDIPGVGNPGTKADMGAYEYVPKK